MATASRFPLCGYSTLEAWGGIVRIAAITSLNGGGGSVDVVVVFIKVYFPLSLSLVVLYCVICAAFCLLVSVCVEGMACRSPRLLNLSMV